MTEYLKDLFEQNQTLTTIFSSGIVATLVMHSRVIFSILKENILNLISFDITNINRDVGYDNSIEDDLSIFLKNQRNLFQRNYEIKTNGIISNGFGVQWYIIFGKFVRVNRELETSNNTILLKTYIRIYFANKNKFITKLKNVIGRVSNIYENKVNINFQWYNNKRDKRSLESIYTNDNIQYNVLNDIKKFIESKKFYRDNNIPYKRNYLFYGEPGTGKTSLIFALASELNYNIKIIDLGSFNDLSQLLSQIYNCDNNTFLVFEDIDAMNSEFQERTLDQSNVKNTSTPDMITPLSGNKNISLSILLNLLDGLYTKDGMIAFFTTNHIEKLDKAFLRDGRMDYKLELCNLNKKTIENILFKKLNKNYNIKIDNINPSTLQEIIIQRMLNNINDIELTNKINHFKENKIE